MAEPDPTRLAADVPVAARYGVVDLTLLDPSQAEAVVPLPPGLAHAIGILVVPHQEGVPDHGTLASHHDLVTFISETTRNQRPLAEATAMWHVLARQATLPRERWRGGDLAQSHPELSDLAADLFGRLFVRLPQEAKEYVDADVLRALLEPLPPQVGLKGSLLSNLQLLGVSSYRLQRLSGFVNKSLGLTGDEALPEDLHLLE